MCSEGLVIFSLHSSLMLHEITVLIFLKFLYRWRFSYQINWGGEREHYSQTRCSLLASCSWTGEEKGEIHIMHYGADFKGSCLPGWLRRPAFPSFLCSQKLVLSQFKTVYPFTCCSYDIHFNVILNICPLFLYHSLPCEVLNPKFWWYCIC